MQIEKRFDKKAGRDYWYARFQLNGKTFRPRAETRRDLEALVDKIRVQERAVRDNERFGLADEVRNFVPTVEEYLREFAGKMNAGAKRTFAERVFKTFVRLLPPDLRVDQLRKTHFVQYRERRISETGMQSKLPISASTAMKELYAISAALEKVAIEYPSLESWEKPRLPRSTKKGGKRNRIVTSDELQSVIAELMKDPEGKQSRAGHAVRVRLAHLFEFGELTGLRRKELARLKFAQFDRDRQALLNVKRYKTDSVTAVLPLGRRAIEIIEERRRRQPKGCPFIFSENGEPSASMYRTLRAVCRRLEIPYGRFVEGGFIPHDLRHNFGTAIMQNADIETARELLGHSNISQTGTYVHTDEARMRDAVRKRDKQDLAPALRDLYDRIRDGKLELPDFLSELKALIGF